MNPSNYLELRNQLREIINDSFAKYLNGLSNPEIVSLVALCYAPIHSVNDPLVAGRWKEVYQAHSTLNSLVAEIGHMVKMEINSGALTATLCHQHLGNKPTQVDLSLQTLGQFALAYVGHYAVGLIPVKTLNAIKQLNR